MREPAELDDCCSMKVGSLPKGEVRTVGGARVEVAGCSGQPLMKEVEERKRMVKPNEEVIAETTVVAGLVDGR